MEFTPETAARLIRRVLFDEWTQMLTSGYVTEQGLVALRSRLDGTTNEFAPGPDLELLRLKVNDALARARGIDPAELPGAVVVPDDLSEITDGNL